MPYGRAKGAPGIRSFSYGEKYGFSRKDIVVKVGRRIAIGSRTGVIVSVNDDISHIEYDDGGNGITLTSTVRNMREITPRETF